MRIIETDSRLVLRDVPIGLWLFGLVFVASGTFVLASPLWASEWRDFKLWVQLAILAIGVAHVAGGLHVAGRARATVTELDLTGSESLWLQAQAVHGEARVREQAERVRHFLRLGDVGPH